MLGRAKGSVKRDLANTDGECCDNADRVRIGAAFSCGSVYSGGGCGS